jgi:hypothetical protein
VEEAGHAPPSRRLEKIQRPLDVDELDQPGIRVVAVQGGHMDDRVAARDRALERRDVEEVDALVANVGASLAQLPGNVPADEAGRAGDVDLHGARAAR